MEMREAAEAYCEAVEGTDGANRSTFVSDLVRTLAAVVAAAYRIPDIESTSEVDGDEPSGGITQEQWDRRYSAIQGVVGDWGLYWTAPEAYRLDESTHEPALNEESFHDRVEVRHLADDLADIWRDLRDGLDALDRGTSADDVSWEWRLGFRTHWGAHAVEALRALHQQATR